MSADEIRRLAAENIFVEVADKRYIGEGEVCDYSYEKKSEINAALLDYAAMVDRCEKEYAEIQKRIKEWPNHGEEPVYAHQLQWCLERIRGNAGKEEK